MLYIIGLGLNVKGISLEGIEAVKKCKKIYLEGYTVEFPYSTLDLEKVLSCKIEVLDREGVEDDKLVKESKKEDVCLLVYGAPLFATTHMTLIKDCKSARVKFKIIYASSVFDAIAESGLQLYKFGKISSMPKWEKNFEPMSFLDYVVENSGIGAHSLILVDIGLKFEDALNELVESARGRKFELGKVLVCSQLGISGKFYYGSVDGLKGKNVKAPYCFVIPSKMHFAEEEVVSGFKV